MPTAEDLPETAPSFATKGGHVRSHIRYWITSSRRAGSRLSVDRQDISIAGICIAATLLIWIVLLAVTQPVYEAVMIVGPTPSNARSELSSLLPSSALSLLGASSLSSSATNDYEVFRQLMSSEEVAQVLLDMPDFKETVLRGVWDPLTKKIRRGGGLRSTIAGALNAAVGIKDTTTDRNMLATYLATTVTDTPVERTGFDRITARSTDPQAARILLVDLYKADDGYLEHIRMIRLQHYVSYLEDRVRSATNETARAALIDLIVDQDRELMLVQSGMPYAAEIVRAPATENRPLAPRPLQWLAIAIITGLIMSIGVIYARRRIRASSI